MRVRRHLQRSNVGGMPFLGEEIADADHSKSAPPRRARAQSPPANCGSRCRAFADRVDASLSASAGICRDPSSPHRPARPASGRRANANSPAGDAPRHRAPGRSPVASGREHQPAPLCGAPSSTRAGTDGGMRAPALGSEVATRIAYRRMRTREMVMEGERIPAFAATKCRRTTIIPR